MKRAVLGACFAGASCAVPNSDLQNGLFAATPLSGEARVAVSFSPRVEARFGSPIDLEIQLRNDGDATAMVPGPHGQWLTPEIQDAAGRAVICHKRPQNFMPILKKLEPGQSLAATVDLSAWCTFPRPGEYRATFRYETRGQRMTPVTGTGATVVVLIAGS